MITYEWAVSTFTGIFHYDSDERAARDHFSSVDGALLRRPVLVWEEVEVTPDPDEE